MTSAKGSADPPRGPKPVWTRVILAIMIGKLMSGSVEVAKTLAVSGAILFSLAVRL
jgi:choline-glycine betaine transporter